MMDLNRVFFTGRLVRDAELKYTTANLPVCQFDIAVNRARRDGDGWVDEVMFLNRISFWGEQAERRAEHLKKGKMILVEGRLRMDEWEKDGQKRRELRVVANHIQILSSPKSDGGSGGGGGAFQEKSFEKPKTDLVSEDDLPF